jgi:hypothetical protein
MTFKDGDIFRTTAGYYMVVLVSDKNGVVSKQALDLELGIVAMDNFLARNCKDKQVITNLCDIIQTLKNNE